MSRGTTYAAVRVKAGFHMIADDRGSQIAESSAIVCDHMETHFCDRLRSCDHLRSFAILRSRKKEKSVRISIVWSMLRYLASSKINNKPLTDTKYDFSIIVEKMEN